MKRVFISYARHPDAGVADVRELVARLAQDGVPVVFDEADPDPSAGWPLWCERGLESADRVLIVCTEPWRRRSSGKLDAYGGRGVAWEARIIRNMVFRDAVAARFVPLTLAGADGSQCVPLFLQDRRRFEIMHEYDALLSALEDVRGAKSVLPEFEPPLNPIVREVVVACDGSHRTMADAVALKVGAEVKSLDATEPALFESGVVVVLAAEVPRWLARVDRAPERELVTGARSHGTASLPEVELVAAVQGAVHRRRRTWIRRSAGATALGGLAAAAAPLVAPTLWPLGVWAILMWLAGASLLLLGGARRALATGDTLVPRHADRAGWQLYTATFARTLLRGSETSYWRRAVSFGVAYALLWAWKLRAGGYAASHLEPLIVVGLAAVALGVMAGMSSRRGGWVGWGVVGALATGGWGLANVVSHWGIIGETWAVSPTQAVMMLIRSRPSIEVAFILAGPALAPVSMAGAAALVFLLGRAEPLWERVAPEIIGGMALAATLMLAIS